MKTIHLEIDKSNLLKSIKPTLSLLKKDDVLSLRRILEAVEMGQKRTLSLT